MMVDKIKSIFCSEKHKITKKGQYSVNLSMEGNFRGIQKDVIIDILGKNAHVPRTLCGSKNKAFFTVLTFYPNIDLQIDPRTEIIFLVDRYAHSIKEIQFY